MSGGVRERVGGGQRAGRSCCHVTLTVFHRASGEIRDGNHVELGQRLQAEIGIKEKKRGEMSLGDGHSRPGAVR